MRHLAALELHDDAEREPHVPPGRWDPREQLWHLDVVREREHELVDDLVVADRPRHRRDLDVLRPLPDEVVAIELAHVRGTHAAGHRGEVVDVRLVGHRRHRRLEVHVDELRRDVVVEDAGDVRTLVSVGRHLAAQPISFRPSGASLTCQPGAGLNPSMLLREVAYARPSTVDEAIAVLAGNEGARALAGGQTLINVMKARVASPEVLVDLADLEELRAIGFSADGLLEIGAMVTYTQLMASSEVDVARPILAEVASTIGDVQVRNRGTVGGNVCVADPTNHLPPLFSVLDATFTIGGSGGERTVSADDFFQGVYLTAVGEGELLTKVSVPPSKGAGDGFAGLTIGKQGTYVVNA